MMLERSDLPRELTRWATALARLSPELTRALGPWITRFAAAFGALRVRADLGRAEPDGYDGLSRRGALDQLLSTEWLLASEIPEKFERRLAMSELGYLSLARVEPRKAGGSVALLDAGPSQLGALRVHQLAALVALSERASRAGARFAFAAMTGAPDEATWWEALHNDSLTAWVEARRATELTESETRAWCERARDFEDRWIIGGKSSVENRQFDGWNRLCLQEPLGRGPRRVRATVQCAEAAPAEIEHDILADGLATRILRDPRGMSRARDAAPRSKGERARMPVGNLVWSDSSHKVFARTERGELLVFSVPRDPRVGGAKPIIVHPQSVGSRVIAAGWARRRLVLLERVGDQIMFGDWRGDRFGRTAMTVTPVDGAVETATDFDGHGPLGGLVAYHRDATSSEFTLRLRDRVYRLDAFSHREGISGLHRHVRAVSVIGREMVLASVPEGAKSVTVTSSHGELARVEFSTHDTPSEVLLGPLSLAWSRQRCEIAFCDGRRWTVLGLNQAPWECEFAPGDRAVGVVSASAERTEAALLVLRDSGRSLDEVRAGAQRVLHEIWDPAVEVQVSPDGDRVAWINTTGALVVFSRSLNAVLMRWPRELEP